MYYVNVMAGNTFGKLFTVTTFGESHGTALGCVVDGCPAGLPLSEAIVQPFLDKRCPGQSKYVSQRRETDAVQILSGVFAGLTTGAPIAMTIYNHNQRVADYDAIKDIFRPGHADFTYYNKYGHRDYRGGGRASARETVARVAAGAVARIYLKRHLNLEIVGFLQQLGSISIDFVDKDLPKNNAFFCPNTHQIDDLIEYIENLRKIGDSAGARIGIHAYNMPIGLGDPVFDKLNATLAYAMMSINAVKGVEIGSGFAAVTQLGREHRDEMNAHGFLPH